MRDGMLQRSACSHQALASRARPPATAQWHTGRSRAGNAVIYCPIQVVFLNATPQNKLEAGTDNCTAFPSVLQILLLTLLLVPRVALCMTVQNSQQCCEVASSSRQAERLNVLNIVLNFQFNHGYGFFKNSLVFPVAILTHTVNISRQGHWDHWNNCTDFPPHLARTPLKLFLSTFLSYVSSKGAWVHLTCFIP